MSLYIPPQAYFFYKEKWTPTVDHSLLETIIRLKHENQLEGTVIPKRFFHIAVADLSYDLGVDVAWDALYDRLQPLPVIYGTCERKWCYMDKVQQRRGRHRRDLDLDFPGMSTLPKLPCTFNLAFLLFNSYVMWLKKKKLAGAYYYCGDPAYDQLSTMFGPKVSTEEEDNAPVVISDTTIAVFPTVQVTKHARSDTSETVVSPLWPNKPKVRRKLFEEDEVDEEHDTSVGGTEFCYALAPKRDKGKKTRRLNVAGRPPIPEVSPGGSTCGSSSLVAWWKRLTQ